MNEAMVKFVDELRSKDPNISVSKIRDASQKAAAEGKLVHGFGFNAISRYLRKDSNPDINQHGYNRKVGFLREGIRLKKGNELKVMFEAEFGTQPTAKMWEVAKEQARSPGTSKSFYANKLEKSRVVEKPSFRRVKDVSPLKKNVEEMCAVFSACNVSEATFRIVDGVMRCEIKEIKHYII